MSAPIERVRLAFDGMVARGLGRIVDIAWRSVKQLQPELALCDQAHRARGLPRRARA
jgi:hypothetical protein